MTDVHLNPYHDPSGDVRDMCRTPTVDAARKPGLYGHFNCDPSPHVVELAFAHMASIEPAPAAILLGGDDLGHVPASKEGAEAARASQRAVAAALRKAFPQTAILPTVGNHDTWPYFTARGEGALEARRELASLYGDALAPAPRRHLASRGYYLHKLTRRLWVAVLETNALALADAAADGAAQLAWLDETLSNAEAARASVLVLGHIAPGASHVDYDSMAAAGWEGGGLTARSQEALYELLRKDARRGGGGGGAGGGPLAALFFGHLHTGSVRLLEPPTSHLAEEPESAVIHLSPSLTPRNPTPHMPAVRLYEFAAPAAHSRMELLEVYEHRLDLDASNGRGGDSGAAEGRGGRRLVWRASSLREELNLTGRLSSASTWRSWARRLLGDEAGFGALMTPQRCADEIEADYGRCKAAFLCAALEPQPQPYAACLRRTKSARPPEGWVPSTKRMP